MRALLAAALLLAFPAAGARAQNDRVQWNQPIEPFRVAGNVYYVGVEGIATYLITTPQGHILVDGGFEETAPIILSNVRRLGFRPAHVKYLVITHGHNDHAGGLAAWRSGWAEYAQDSGYGGVR